MVDHTLPREYFPAYITSALLPKVFKPDRILVTDEEALICIIGHPHARNAFWINRIKRYEHLLREARAVAIALSDEQKLECLKVLSEFDVKRRFLVVTRDSFHDIESRLKH